MTEYKIKRLQDAPTIKALHDRLEEAMVIAGEDAAWNGFDDEAIYIYPKKGEQISIFPGGQE
ncbi:MAG: hypothetical protein COX19_03350 [Desulfobacterales bacterium CG23_combo_of_CG06-09_8_20_14_all_51_8]|nr:MAG: hypothetical protein COX19_03350 [Desulfobacterales bacterium CG23_combo_of_CG06-09_8_20_14_all_51_8]